MSTVPPPGWWQASDGGWYPPEMAPSAQPAATPRPVPRLHWFWAFVAAAAVATGGIVYASMSDSGAPHSVGPETTWTPTEPGTTGPTTDDTTDTTTSTSPTDSGNATDITALIGQSWFSDAGSQAERQYGCHQDRNAASTFPCPSSGVIFDTTMGVESTIVMITLKNVDGTEGTGYQTFTGRLPAGLSWSMARAEVEQSLVQQFGQPVNIQDYGPEGDTREDFAVTGQNFGGLTVEFVNSTGTLIRIEINRDAPYPTS